MNKQVEGLRQKERIEVWNSSQKNYKSLYTFRNPESLSCHIISYDEERNNMQDTRQGRTQSSSPKNRNLQKSCNRAYDGPLNIRQKNCMQSP